jgi:hypothetical protein
LPASRTKKFFISFATILAFFLIIAVVVRHLVLPNVIESRLIQALQESGITDASVEVQAAAFDGASLQNLILGKEGRVHIGGLKIGYSPASVMKGQLDAMHLSGAKVDLQIRDGVIDLGPLASFGGPGGPELPFERLELKESRLDLNWNGKSYQIPIEGIMENGPDGTSKINLHASLNEAPITVSAEIDVNTLEGEGEIRVDDLQSGAFVGMLPFHDLSTEGSLDITGQFVLENGQWQAKLQLAADRLNLRYVGEAEKLEFPLTDLEADLALTSEDSGAIDLVASLNDAPLTLRTAMDLNTFEGEYNIGFEELDAGILTKIAAPYSPGSFETGGVLASNGKIRYEKNRGSASFEFIGDQFLLQTEINGHDVDFSPARWKANVIFAGDSGTFRIKNGTLEIDGMQVANKSLGISAEHVSCKLPFSWEDGAVKDATFTLETIGFRQHELAGLSGKFNVADGRVDFAARGNVLPEANLEARGSLDWSQGRLSGRLDAEIPKFALKNGPLLAKRFPMLASYDLDGSFTAETYLRLENGQITPFIRLDIEDAMVASTSSEAGAEGLTGAITLNSIAPLATDGDQRFYIKKAYGGSFSPTDCNIVFNLVDRDSILLKSIDCNWLGGKLSSRNINVELSESRMSLDLNAEGLALQEILDFVQYDGVKGDGQIFGHLPITIYWGEQSRISFGDGFFEARPNKGRLQLSEENARAILGISDDIDPIAADLEKRVGLMVLYALQDMEYSKLRIDFANEEKGWMTRIQTEGYGPREAKENRVPIGGLTVNINDLDELLNSLIYSKIGSGKVRID